MKIDLSPAQMTTLQKLVRYAQANISDKHVARCLPSQTHVAEMVLDNLQVKISYALNAKGGAK